MRAHPFPVLALGLALALGGCGKVERSLGGAENPAPAGGAATTAAATLADVGADASGNLHVPKAYRDAYQYLGTWAPANDPGVGSKEMHIVYVAPGAVAQFRKAGKFADGTTLVKEVYEASTAPMTTGTVSRPQKLKGWFVMVKDSSNRHAATNKLWGDGWGWAWFDAASPTKTASTDYQSDCKGCHEPAQKTDWLYTDGYQPLKGPGA
ncbi:MAG: cytochrome C [Proteobacteria bacterium SG_bin5]|nr:cytochrome P460 family protein [Sphingomonas sp.]OQW40604.1 MAG: cytochrome C [Proteobacteria bacterium SG_bin5]